MPASKTGWKNHRHQQRRRLWLLCRQCAFADRRRSHSGEQGISLFVPQTAGGGNAGGISGQYPQLKQIVFRPGTILGENVSNQITNLFEKKIVLGIKGP
jgi:hypothetical protein